MNITSNNWSLTIDLMGGRIMELSYRGVKVLGTYNRIDGKQGNTHLCIPSFDKEGVEKYNLPFHGLVRNNLWILERGTENELYISTTTQSTANYPAILNVTQTFYLGEVFEHKITVSHVSGQPVPLNVGIHYYWDTPSGWDKIIIGNQNQKDTIETNGSIDLLNNNLIQFPQTTYELTSNGFHSAVLWTSFKTNENALKEYSQDFCCIEPVLKWPGYFGGEESMLYPGKNISASIKIKKVV